MTIFLKILNIILITALTAFVGLVSTFFFLGSDKAYSALQETLPSSFARRAIGGICIGIIGAAVILLMNYIFMKATNRKTANFKKLFWGTVVLTSLASIVGTIIFFSH